MTTADTGPLWDVDRLRATLLEGLGAIVSDPSTSPRDLIAAGKVVAKLTELERDRERLARDRLALSKPAGVPFAETIAAAEARYAERCRASGEQP
jgi:hypothetical protein